MRQVVDVCFLQVTQPKNSTFEWTFKLVNLFFNLRIRCNVSVSYRLSYYKVIAVNKT